MKCRYLIVFLFDSAVLQRCDIVTNDPKSCSHRRSYSSSRSWGPSSQQKTGSGTAATCCNSEYLWLSVHGTPENADLWKHDFFPQKQIVVKHPDAWMKLKDASLPHQNASLPQQNASLLKQNHQSKYSITRTASYPYFSLWEIRVIPRNARWQCFSFWSSRTSKGSRETCTTTSWNKKGTAAKGSPGTSKERGWCEYWLCIYATVISSYSWKKRIWALVLLIPFSSS